MNMKIKITDFLKQYKNHTVKIDDIVINGRVSLIVGQNGSGKSTLLKAIGGIIKYSGNIECDHRVCYMDEFFSFPSDIELFTFLKLLNSTSVSPKKEEYSGRFVLRIPKSLHATLASSASKEGTSLNTHIVTLLSWAHCGYSLEKKLDEIVVPIKDLLSENKNEAVPKFPYVFVGEESITVLDQEKTEMFWGEVNESKH
jgi:energy-coupling factor transporter ATP-binding protein EcfA2